MMNQKILDLIQRRRLQILVHSCIYYELDNNIISDKQWDEWARELVNLQNENPEESENAPWYGAFKDWDASTGAFLPLKNVWVMNKARWILAQNQKSAKAKVNKSKKGGKLF